MIGQQSEKESELPFGEDTRDNRTGVLRALFSSWWSRRSTEAWQPPAGVLSPVHRTIVAVDIEGSTKRTDTVKARLRKVLYDSIEAALKGCGIMESHRDRFTDRGDGALILIRPVDQAPKTLIVSTFIPLLEDLLAEHDVRDPGQLRLRAAVHAGEVNYDRRGCFGEAVDLTCRLLDAPELKHVLRGTPSRLMVVISDHFYQSVIKNCFDSLDGRKFTPHIRVTMAGREHIGWIPAPPLEP